jgi:hypothetical protein
MSDGSEAPNRSFAPARRPGGGHATPPASAETPANRTRHQTDAQHGVRMVEDVLELEADEQSQMFGEALPIGLRLLRADN